MPNLPPHQSALPQLLPSRREMLIRSGLGLGAIGLSGLLSSEGQASAAPANGGASSPLGGRAPHFRGFTIQVVERQLLSVQATSDCHRVFSSS